MKSMRLFCYKLHSRNNLFFRFLVLFSIMTCFSFVTVEIWIVYLLILQNSINICQEKWRKKVPLFCRWLTFYARSTSMEKKLNWQTNQKSENKLRSTSLVLAWLWRNSVLNKRKYFFALNRSCSRCAKMSSLLMRWWSSKEPTQWHLMT